MKLSLVIPCYNEARNLPGLVERCARLTAGGDAEVILVDNGSKDDSPAVLAKLLPGAPGCRSVRVDVNQGYGFGILSGLRATQGDIIGWTHADLQTDPLDAVAGMAHFRDAADPTRLFVKGRRYGRPASDVAFTMGMTMFETLLLGHVLADVNAQPTLFHRDYFATWRSPPHDFSLDLYAYANAKRAGMSVKRFPVRFGERLHGQSSWNVDWKSKWKFIRRTVDYSLKLRAASGGVDRGL